MKKTIYIILCISLLFSNGYTSADTYKENDSFIIELLDNNDVNDVIEKLNNILGERIEIQYIYKDLINGFSASLSEKAVSILKDLPEVKNIFESKKIEVPVISPVTTQKQITLLEEGLPYNNTQYKGKKTIVAILDSEFLCNHSVFKELNEAEAKYSKEDIANFLNTKILNAEGNIDDIYYNSKIPFMYDYGEYDNNLSATVSYHGTSVASAVSGNNDGVTGSAPDSQIAFFKVANKGEITTNAIIAALEDAYVLNVDAVNISFGSVSQLTNHIPLLPYILDRLTDKGIAVFCSAGNSGIAKMSSNNYNNYPLCENTDYGQIGSPSNNISAISVGALDASSNIASFSSYGASNDLRIKPEITYSGKDIYLAYASGKTYKRKVSGTSFSAPLSCGFYLSLKDYLNSTTANLSEREKYLIGTNLLMSSADKIKTTDGIPYSPRGQGSGKINIENAISSPVYLLGDDNRCVKNLKDGKEGNFSFSFTAVNISDEEVSYSLSADITTDGYFTQNNVNYSSLRPISIPADAKYFLGNEEVSQLTLPGKSIKEISVEVNIPDDFKENNGRFFTNGFFAEGYINLESDIYPSLSIPYMRYIGDWNAPSMFDTKRFFDKFGFYDNDERFLSENEIDKSVISKVYFNNNFSILKLGLLRTAQKFSISLYNDGQPVLNEDGTGLIKYSTNNSQPVYSSLPTKLFNCEENKEYIFELKCIPEYENGKAQTYKINIIRDDTPPDFTVKRVLKGGKAYLDIQATDYNLLQFVKIYAGSETPVISRAISVDSGKTFSELIDVTNYQYKSLSVEVSDYAGNTAYFSENSNNFNSYYATFENEILLNAEVNNGMLDETKLLTYMNENKKDNRIIRYFLWNCDLSPASYPLEY